MTGSREPIMKAYKDWLLAALVTVPAVIGAPGAFAQPAGGFPGGALPPLGAAAPPAGGTPGSAGLVFIREQPPLPADAPMPSPDPRNFEGTWFQARPGVITADMFGQKLPYTAVGQKKFDLRVKGFREGNPYINASALCLPTGQPWQMDSPAPFEIFQTPDRLVLLFEEYHGMDVIAIDPANAMPRGYMGQSNGHWDGSTLVVDTTGFKDDMWLDINGTPASKNATLTQRIRKVKGDQWYLEVQYTLEDPAYYSKAWSWARRYAWRPDMTLFRDFDCELQTGAKGGLTPGLVPEPKD
jgi:hypothetical protein